MRLFLAILLFASLLNSNEIKPSHTYKVSGGVTDLILQNNKLFISTNASSIEIFNLSNNEKELQIDIPKTKDFTGDLIHSKIYSLDVLKNNILYIAQGEKGFRRLAIIKNGKIENLLDEKDKLYLSKAKFIDDNHILISLLSNQMFLYNIEKKEFLWEIQVSQSKFSDFVLNEKKDLVFVADESGSIKKIKIKDSKLLKTYSGINVDNVFQVDTKNSIIITAGQDRRCGIFNEKNQDKYYIKSDFLVYSVGLSPSGKLGAYSSSEENEIEIFDTQTKKTLYKLGKHKMILTNIVFKNENELFSSSDDNNVYLWNLK